MNHSSNLSFNYGLRQIILFTSLIFGLVLAAVLVIWSQEGSFPFLDKRSDTLNAPEIKELLDSKGIDYQIEQHSGKILVPIDRIDEINHRIPVLSLPSMRAATKFPVNDTSNSIQSGATNHQYEMEENIARSIMAIENVEFARVLLAFPEKGAASKQSRAKSSASVMVKLSKGQSLDKNQSLAVVSLVAASVPTLEATQVTLVDQTGKLLNGGKPNPVAELTESRAEFKKSVEEHIREKIINILIPVVDPQGIKVNVFAELEFFNNNAMSEKPVKFLSLSDLIYGGEFPTTSENSSAASKLSQGLTARKEAEHKMPIDPEGEIKAALHKLTSVVWIDNKQSKQEDGAVISQPFSKEEIERFTGLVKQAAGFDSNRGDQVTVTNVAFKKAVGSDNPVDLPFWKTAWFLIVLRQITAGLALLLVFLGLIFPPMRKLMGRDQNSDSKKMIVKDATVQDSSMEGRGGFNQNDVTAGQLEDVGRTLAAMPGDLGKILSLEMPKNYLQRLEYLKKLADVDAKLVAEVIKSWMKKDG